MEEILEGIERHFTHEQVATFYNVALEQVVRIKDTLEGVETLVNYGIGGIKKRIVAHSELVPGDAVTEVAVTVDATNAALKMITDSHIDIERLNFYVKGKRVTVRDVRQYLELSK